MDVFDLRDRVIADYGAYVRSFVAIRDERIQRLVSEEMEAGFLWPDPLIQLSPSFEPGDTLRQLIDEQVLHPECINIFRDKREDGKDRGPLRLHRHQEEGIRAAGAGANYVLTTGTGSGKSLTYILPIVDHVLRRGGGRVIQAIIVYPMNALANSQMGELEKFLCRGYPNGRAPVTFKRYTGQESEEERNRIIAKPPDIPLTNYVMLEMALTRPWDYQLIKAARGLACRCMRGVWSGRTTTEPRDTDRGAGGKPFGRTSSSLGRQSPSSRSGTSPSNQSPKRPVSVAATIEWVSAMSQARQTRGPSWPR